MSLSNTAYAMRGDPGLRDWFGRGLSVVKTGLNIGLGLATNPVGTGLGIIRQVTSGSQPTMQTHSLPFPDAPVGRMPTTMPSGPSPSATPSGAPQGYHLNRSAYWTKAGYVPKGSKWVKNRRKNYANGRALRKSITRVRGFEREVKRSRKALRSLAKI